MGAIKASLVIRRFRCGESCRGETPMSRQWIANRLKMEARVVFLLSPVSTGRSDRRSSEEQVSPTQWSGVFACRTLCLAEAC
jgi:hypothetical protein